MIHQKMKIGPNKLKVNIVMGKAKEVNGFLKKFKITFQEMVEDDDFLGFTTMLHTSKESSALVILKPKIGYDTVIHELDHVTLFYIEHFKYEDPSKAQEFKVSLLTRMIQDFEWQRFGYPKFLDKAIEKN